MAGLKEVKLIKDNQQVTPVVMADSVLKVDGSKYVDDITERLDSAKGNIPQLEAIRTEEKTALEQIRQDEKAKLDALKQDFNSKAVNIMPKTWIATQENPSKIKNISFGNGKYVAGFTDGTMAYSTDGLTWIPINQSFYSGGSFDICYGNDMFIAGSDRKMARSTDGVTWEKINLTGYGYYLCYGNGKFVCCNKADKIAWSTDGLDWHIVNTAMESIYGICFGNDIFVLYGVYRNGAYPCNTFGYSTDCLTWEILYLAYSIAYRITGLCFGNGIFVATTLDYFSYVSTDGISWKSTHELSYYDGYSICYGNGKFVAQGQSSLVYSTDGLTWTTISNTGDYGYSGTLRYINGMFIIVKDNKIAYCRTELSTWKE